MAVSVVAIMPVCLLIARLFAVRIRRLTSEIRQRDGEVQSHIQESLQHLVLVQTLERESWVEQRLYGIQQGLYRLVMERSRLSVYSRAMVNSAFSVGYAVAFLWGVEGIQKGTITFGMMTAFLQLVGQIQRPLVEMGQQLPGILHAMTSVDRLIELEDDSEETDIEPVTLPGGLGIRLEQVTYAYPDGQRVILDHFSHDFSPSQRDLRSAVVDVQAQQRVALRLADPLRQVVDERFGHLLDRQLHDHLLDRVAHLLQLNHRNDLEFQLLVVIGLGLHDCVADTCSTVASAGAA